MPKTFYSIPEAYLLAAVFCLGRMVETIGTVKPAYTVDWLLCGNAVFLLLVLPAVAFAVGRESGREEWRHG